jgi:hypothetical protein
MGESIWIWGTIKEQFSRPNSADAPCFDPEAKGGSPWPLATK